MPSSFKYTVLDIETDEIPVTKIHCICCMDFETGETKEFIDNLDEFIEFHKQDPERIYIMHNGVSFDAVVLTRLLQICLPPERVWDTMLASQMIQPHRDGGHSLKAWGERLQFEKIDFKDNFETYSNEMLYYCRQDVALTRKLAQHLQPLLKAFGKAPVRLEHKVRHIITQQEVNGFYLDQKKASMLMADLEDNSGQIKQDLQKIFPPIITERYSDKTGKRLKDNVEVFNPNSRQQIVKRLKAVGWHPDPRRVTPKGQPIVDESVLSEIDLSEAKKMSEFLLMQKRVSQIKSWLEAVGPDSRVHGRVITIGCVTHRMSHYSPNMAQIPASYSPYGPECRDCWTVEDPVDYCLVGSDASSLEIRCFAHYLDNQKYTDIVVGGDIHNVHKEALGLADRSVCKTWLYAYIYGAGNEKLGKVVGGGMSEGKQLRDKFESAFPMIRELKNKITVMIRSNHGNIKAIDGRLLECRSEHSALNVLLQSCGSIVCKHFLCEIDRMVKEKKLDAKPVANVHDEVQWEVRRDQAEEFGQITKQAMKQAEKILQFNCPLDSEYHIGTTWKETH